MSPARRIHRTASGLLWVVCCAAACTTAQPKPATHTAPRPKPEPVVARAEPRPPAQVKIKGLHGTLNESDVHQTMDGRQSEFGLCIAQSRRSLRWVSGEIRFAFKVDADGRIMELRCTESSIGHRILEQCLTGVVAETQFRKPSGGATGRFDWQMTVEPASGRPADELDSDRLKPVLRKRTHELVEACGMDRAREHYRVTAYLDKHGRVLSAGAVAQPTGAEDKVDCVLHEIRRWRLPRFAHYGKLTFDVH